MTHASLKKRMAVAALDLVLALLLTALLACAFGALFGYARTVAQIDRVTTDFEIANRINLSITEEVYQSLPEAERTRYDLMIDALRHDPAMIDAYTDLVGATVGIAALSFLVAYLALEILIPLCNKHRATVGGLLLGMTLAQADLSPVRTSTLLGRVLIGKYLMETLLPVIVLIITALEVIPGLAGILILLVFAAVQIWAVAATAQHVPVHGLISGTVTANAAKQ